MNDFNNLVDLFWSFLWILGCISVMLITLVIMKRMIFGASTYGGSSSSNKDLIKVSLFSSITSNNDSGKD